ncbi:MAG: hypothetical protein ACQPRJ_05350 [Solitalea-like symbiont of Acarus siro]
MIYIIKINLELKEILKKKYKIKTIKKYVASIIKIKIKIKIEIYLIQTNKT